MNEMEVAIVAEIEECVRASHLPDDSVIRSWMTNKSLEIRGAVFALLANPRFSDLWPRLSSQNSDAQAFVRQFLTDAFDANVEGEWVLSRYEAAHALAAYVKKSVCSAVTETDIVEIEKWARQTYLTGDESTHRALVDGFLEHAFECDSVKKHFLRWKAAPVLSVAFEEASSWVGREKPR